MNIDRVTLEAAMEWFADRHNVEGPLASVLLEAARAYLSTLPRTKMVECWHVEWAQGSVARMDDPYATERDAESQAKLRRDAGQACVKVTGPHKHEVPA